MKTVKVNFLAYNDVELNFKIKKICKVLAFGSENKPNCLAHPLDAIYVLRYEQTRTSALQHPLVKNVA